MGEDRALQAALIALVGIVGFFAGAVITGPIVGVETEIGASVTQTGSTLLLVSTTMLVLISLLFARRRALRARAAGPSGEDAESAP